MEKILPIFIIGMVVLCGFGTTAFPILKSDASPHIFNSNSSRGKNVDVSFYEDELDQYQTECDGVLPVGATSDIRGTSNLSMAQSFIPQKKILTQVQFYMAKNATASYPCVVAIRENLTEKNLAIASVDPDEFPDSPDEWPPQPENLSWITFNFADMSVIIGQTYYMVMYTANITDNYYWIGGFGSNLYLNGTPFISVDDGVTWGEFPDVDGCFKTYGRNAPDWATGMYSGQWGVSIFGLPIIPLGWFTGFYKQGLILYSFEGIFAGFNVNVGNATGALNGIILGPFMLGGVRNLTTDNGTFFVGLGGRNETTSEFYFRLMVFLGPNYYMYGKYYDFL